MPIVRLFVDICLFRKGPQDVPLSKLLLALTLIFALLASTLISLMEVGFFQALLQSTCATLLLVGYFAGLLKIAGQSPRLPQTLIAALAADGIITAVAFSLFLISLVVPEWQGGASLMLVAMMLWELAVLGRIIQQALGFSSLGPGLGLALVYTALSMRIMMGLFPPLT